MSVFRAADEIPFCGTITVSADALGRWPGDTPRLPWHVDVSGYRGALALEQVRDVFRRAWRYWSAAVDIEPVMVGSPGEALVRIHFAPIDGGSGVLAWSELANDTNTPKTQRYDAGEPWTDSDGSLSPAGIDLVRVAAHEIGHVLGLDHDGGTAPALLQPMYSPRIPKPTERDVQRLVALGYKRRTTPTPVPPVVPDPPPVGPPVPPPASQLVTVDSAARVVTLPAGWSSRSAS